MPTYKIKGTATIFRPKKRVEGEEGTVIAKDKAKAVSVFRHAVAEKYGIPLKHVQVNSITIKHE